MSIRNVMQGSKEKTLKLLVNEPSLTILAKKVKFTGA